MRGEEGTLPFTFILDDPAGNSHIENPTAPRLDPKLRVVFYERTPSQVPPRFFLYFSLSSSSACLALPEASYTLSLSFPSSLPPSLPPSLPQDLMVGLQPTEEARMAGRVDDAKPEHKAFAPKSFEGIDRLLAAGKGKGKEGGGEGGEGEEDLLGRKEAIVFHQVREGGRKGGKKERRYRLEGGKGGWTEGEGGEGGNKGREEGREGGREGGRSDRESKGEEFCAKERGLFGQEGEGGGEGLLKRLNGSGNT
jgi:hypothetical protein